MHEPTSVHGMMTFFCLTKCSVVAVVVAHAQPNGHPEALVRHRAPVHGKRVFQIPHAQVVWVARCEKVPPSFVAHFWI